MIRASYVTLALLGGSALASCDSDARSPATVALAARGTTTPTFLDDGFTITIDRADVAFGPAYVCATAASSSGLCGTSVLETTQVHRFDALDPAPTSLGALTGFTGDVRTVQYDLGFTFRLAASAPMALPGAVDGHSVVIEGRADDGVVAFGFVARVDVTADVSGTTAIVGAPAVASIAETGTTLTLEADPAAWLEGLDWAGLAALPHPPDEPVEIPAGSRDHDAILRGITTNDPIRFVWGVAE